MKDVYMSREFFMHFSHGLMVMDQNRKILDINPAYVHITGYNENEIKGRGLDVLRSNKHNEVFYQKMWKGVEEKGIWEGEIWNRKKSGELFLEKRTVYVNRDENDEIIRYIFFLRDITNERIKERKLEELHYKDLVTDLPNKYIFQELFSATLEKAERRNDKLAVVFMDLDRFQKVNETFGYVEGDQTLKIAAKRIRENAGEEIMITRMGGDLFVLVFPKIQSEEHLAHNLDRIGMSFKNEPFVINGQEVFLSVCMGVSMYPTDGKDREELFRNADLARYRAKENGGDNYQFYMPSLNVKLFERLMMETNLRRSLEKGELTVFYQPQIDVATRRIVGMEALVRWIHPDLGVVSPAKFIPLAEETGLIIPIGEWVLTESCRQLKKWHEQGHTHLTVGVNISPRQFQRGNLPQTVKNALKQSGLEPKYLDLEVTESMIMKDVEDAIDILKELEEIGVSISIDDFGTGYSSLSYLARLPLHCLKIDRSFIQKVHKNKEDTTIVSTIISMAKQLQLKVVAEGVETEEQLAFLQQEQCDKYQGFLTSPPVPADQFERTFFQHKTNE